MIEDLSKLTKAQLIERLERIEDAERMARHFRSHRRHQKCENDQLCWRTKADESESYGAGFDEVVVGDWLHIEMLSGGSRRSTFWARVGDTSFWFQVTPKKVTVSAYESGDGLPVELVWEAGEPK